MPGMSQPSDTSSPAVRHNPCTSARVGIGSASIRFTAVRSCPKPAISCVPSPLSRASTTRWNTLTSAPPVNASPSARQTSARASDPSASSRQAISAS
jgi:hypothetical protein